MPVRRKPPTIGRTFGAVRLYLDDLSQIDAVVRDVAEDTMLEADGYELDGLDDLTTVSTGDVIGSVVWIGSLGSSSGFAHLSVELSGHRVCIQCYKCNRELRGALDEVGELLRQRRRRFAGMTLRLWSWLFVPLFFSFTALALMTSESVPLQVCAIAGQGLTVAWVLYTAWLVRHRAVLVCTPRSQHSSFWKRKRDDVLLLLIGAVVGSVPTGLITYLVSRNP